MSAVKSIDTESLKQGLEDGSILLIDVREQNEYAGGRIPGSLSLPLSQLEAEDIPINSGKRVVFSCAAGVRSIKALQIAQAYGLTLDEHYGPGFRGWVAAGEPVEQD